MNRTQQILAGVLIAQIALAVFMLWPQPAKAAGEPLLGGLTADQIVSFTVSDTSGNSATLEKDGEAWVLADSDGFPADSETINTLMADVVQISTGRTVTKTAESHARLQVAEDDYLRRVVLVDAEGKEYTLYVGSSIGTSSTHVRLEGSNEVLLTDKVTGYDFGSEPRNWIEATYVTVDRAKMTGMTLQNANGTFKFTNEGTAEEENWVMADLAEGEIFNPNNMVSMLTRLGNLQIKKPLGKTELPEYGMEKPSAVVTLDYLDESGAAQQLVVTVGAFDEADESYYVKASTSDYYVKISSYTMTDFAERSKVDFLPAE